MIEYEPVKYKNYVFPSWAEYLGWCIALSSIIAIPIYAIVLFTKQTGTMKEVRYISKYLLFVKLLFFSFQRWRKVTTATIDRNSSVDDDDNETKQRMLTERTTAMTNL